MVVQILTPRDRTRDELILKHAEASTCMRSCDFDGRHFETNTKANSEFHLRNAEASICMRSCDFDGCHFETNTTANSEFHLRSNFYVNQGGAPGPSLSQMLRHRLSCSLVLFTFYLLIC